MRLLTYIGQATLHNDPARGGCAFGQDAVVELDGSNGVDYESENANPARVVFEGTAEANRNVALVLRIGALLSGR